MLYLIRAVSLLAVIQLIIIPCSSLPSLAALAFFFVVMLYIISGIKTGHFLKRNSMIVVFSVTFFIFSVLSRYLTAHHVNLEPVLLHVIKIITIFNIITLGLDWIGTKGLIYIISLVPSYRLKCFLLLLYHWVTAFLKAQKNIIYQIQSRIDLKTGEKYRIPRYYVMNLISKELYSLQNFHAALTMRLPETFPEIVHQPCTVHEYIITFLFLFVTVCAGVISYFGII